MSERWGPILAWFEIFSTLVFAIEYAARAWACTADSRFGGRVLGRLRFAVTPLALVDLVAVLPGILGILAVADVVDLRFLRILRFFRLLRLAKIGRYSESLKTLGAVLRSKREELVLAIVVAAVLIVVTSSFIYFAEHEAQPEAFASIPHAMWWAIVTLMTIGYGDVVPVTSLGRIVGALTALLGIGMVALPTAILASGFLEEIQRRKGGARKACPHCGRTLDDHGPERLVPEPPQR